MFKSSNRNQNFTEGPLFSKIILFAVPIMLTSMLQTLYNMADNIVVGQFSGDPLALAAVGSTASLTALVVNLLVGISAGTGVVVAQAFGAKDNELLSRSVHTSIVFAALAGVAFMLIGFAVSKPALIAMGTKAELLYKANTYMCIICAGIPASAVYNFAAAALRSVGDSKTPLIILSTTGIVNVLLNLLFVLAFSMTVDGVALATIIAQYASAAWVLIVLARRNNESYALNVRKLRIHKGTLLRVLRYGVPAALQGSLYSISNIVITSATNVFTTVEISAKTIVSSIDGIAYNSMNSYLHASMTVTAQNYGAGQYRRIKRAFGYSLLQVTVLGVALGLVLTLFSTPLINMFMDKTDPSSEQVFAAARELLIMMLMFYFLCGVQETLSGFLRGLGYSILPMLMSVIGICGVRLLWVFVFFYNIPELKTLLGLYSVYPISWSIASLVLGTACVVAVVRLNKRIREIDATVNEPELVS